MHLIVAGTLLVTASIAYLVLRHRQRAGPPATGRPSRLQLALLWIGGLGAPALWLALLGAGRPPTELATLGALAAGTLGLVLWRLTSATRHLGASLERCACDGARHEARAEIIRRLADAEDADAVRLAVAAAGRLLPDDVEVELWLPDTAPTDQTGVDPAAVTHRLTLRDGSDQRTVGILVAHGTGPLPATSRQILATVGDEVVRALARCRRTAALQRREQHARAIVDYAADAVTVQDPDGRISYANPAMARLAGIPARALVDTYLAELVHPEDAEALNAAMQVLATQPRSTTLLPRRMGRADGGWRWVECRLTNLLDDPAVAGIVAHHRDVTDRKRLERQLEHQSTHDALTGLANRRRLADQLNDSETETNAMVFLDLDRFKDVNDRLGHAIGDRLLATIAARIGTCVRPGDLAARLGGDEFAVLLRGADTEQAERVAARLLEIIREPLVIEGHEIEADASVGIAVAEAGDGRTSRDLLHESDVAMYSAKREGRGRVASFLPEMAEASLHRLELEAALRRALERDELRVMFQPVISLADGRIEGAEALLRWHHPPYGQISPVEFIPVAERTGAIVPIGAWVLREACRQAKEASTREDPFTMHVNVSAVQLREEDFVDDVESALAVTELPPEQLVLEITESVLVDDHVVVRSSIERLRAGGIRLAIDDFGTGWSSLSYLRDVPVDVLKIDRSFVSGVDQGPEEAALARAILQLSETFRLDAVAEGIETEGQRQALLSRGCHLGQGWLFAPALPPEELLDQLARQRADESRPEPVPVDGAPDGSAGPHDASHDDAGDEAGASAEPSPAGAGVGRRLTLRAGGGEAVTTIEPDATRSAYPCPLTTTACPPPSPADTRHHASDGRAGGEPGSNGDGAVGNGARASKAPPAAPGATDDDSATRGTSDAKGHRPPDQHDDAVDASRGRD